MISIYLFLEFQAAGITFFFSISKEVGCNNFTIPKVTKQLSYIVTLTGLFIDVISKIYQWIETGILIESPTWEINTDWLITCSIFWKDTRNFIWIRNNIDTRTGSDLLKFDCLIIGVLLKNNSLCWLLSCLPFDIILISC